jgi:hypothetical protein
MGKRERLLNDAELRRKRLTQIYKDAEDEAVLLLAAALLNPKPAEALRTAQTSIRARMERAGQQARDWADDSLTTLYARGLMDASEQLHCPHPESSPLHLAIIGSLAAVVLEKLQSVNTAVDRNVATLLASAQAGVAGAGLANPTDWQALAAQLRQDVLSKGVTGFIDKAGHSWKVDTYVDVVAQSSVMRAYNAGVEAETQAQGLDLAQLSDEINDNTCGACAQWAGSILSITGATPGFPTVDEAEADGVFHCHCVHTLEPLSAEEAAQAIADNGNSNAGTKEV